MNVPADAHRRRQLRREQNAGLILTESAIELLLRRRTDPSLSIDGGELAALRPRSTYFLLRKLPRRPHVAKSELNLAAFGWLDPRQGSTHVKQTNFLELS